MEIYSTFNRLHLKHLLNEVRQAFPGIKTSEVGLTWSGPKRQRFYYFQYDDFSWQGRAEDASDAKAKGWAAYMAKHAPDWTP